VPGRCSVGSWSLGCAASARVVGIGKKEARLGRWASEVGHWAEISIQPDRLTVPKLIGGLVAIDRRLIGRSADRPDRVVTFIGSRVTISRLTAD
jgi:hypothetical protein